MLVLMSLVPLYRGSRGTLVSPPMSGCWTPTCKLAPEHPGLPTPCATVGGVPKSPKPCCPQHWDPKWECICPTAPSLRTSNPFPSLSQLSSPPPICQREKLLVSFLFNVISTGVAMETRNGVGGLNCLQAARRHWSQGRGPEPGEPGQAGAQAVRKLSVGLCPSPHGGPWQLQCHGHMSPCPAPCSRPCAGPP